MSRYKTKDYSNRREYLDWLAERYGVDRADVVLLSSILGTDQDFDGLPSTLADLPAAKHTQGGGFPHGSSQTSKTPLKLREVLNKTPRHKGGKRLWQTPRKTL